MYNLFWILIVRSYSFTVSAVKCDVCKLTALRLKQVVHVAKKNLKPDDKLAMLEWASSGIFSNFDGKPSAKARKVFRKEMIEGPLAQMEKEYLTYTDILEKAGDEEIKLWDLLRNGTNKVLLDKVMAC